MREPQHHHAPGRRFNPEMVRSVLDHLNHHHAPETLQVANSAGYALQLHQAWLAGLDGRGVDILAESHAGPVVLRLDFPQSASTLTHAGEKLGQLYQDAT